MATPVSSSTHPSTARPATAAPQLTSCPACNQSFSSEILEVFHSFTLHACPDCGLHYWEPRTLPDSGWYERMYLGRDVHLLPLAPGHRAFLNDPAAPRSGTLLDIGCGTGNFLLAAQNAGFAVTGIELDPAAVRYILDYCGISNVLPLTVAELRHSRPESTFDVVAFFEVLEHQADPAQFLQNARASLRSRGFIALTVPNRARWSTGPDPIDYPPNHFLRWDRRSLEKFLDTHGFEVLSFREPPASLSYTAQMINILLRSGLTRAIVPDLPPIFRETIQETGGWTLRQALRTPSARRRILEFLGRVKFAACYPLAFLALPFVRLRGYKDGFLYCLARRKD